MITISDLTVRFGGVVALDNLSLEIVDPICGLIGPNGAGKTTLTNALSGFVQVASGEVVLDNIDLLKLTPHKRATFGLARCFQRAQVAPDLTPTDHLRVVSAAKGIPRSEQRPLFDEILQFVGLTDVADQLLASLTPLQRRMTEIGKCLVGKPRLILLDEPGGGLADGQTQILKDVILGTHEKFGAQIILVDHDMDLIRTVSSTTAVLDFGKLIAFGPTQDVLRDEVVKTAYLGR